MASIWTSISSLFSSALEYLWKPSSPVEPPIEQPTEQIKLSPDQVEIPPELFKFDPTPAPGYPAIQPPSPQECIANRILELKTEIEECDARAEKIKNFDPRIKAVKIKILEAWEAGKIEWKFGEAYLFDTYGPVAGPLPGEEIEERRFGLVRSGGLPQVETAVSIARLYAIISRLIDT